MVRALLIGLACVLAACQAQPRAAADPGSDTSATVMTAAGEANQHGGLACAACHRGKKADVGRASVPREACTASGCHEDAGPPEVTLATARFEHRNHGMKSDIALNCAGCHTHGSGQAPLRANVDACALCHVSKLEGSNPEDCRLCHGQPQHTSLTSQGVPIPHAALPFMETGCSRCHYDVLAPRTKVSVETCTSCHARTSDVTRRGIASDLHPNHRGVQCTSCHQAGLHRIGATSSAVSLRCADCHDRAHDQPVSSQSAVVGTCDACHGDAHAGQQRLVLGVVGNEPVLPSAKFLMGLTCRSCHVPPGAATSSNTVRRGQAAACAACHPAEFKRVLGWWIEGVNTRQRSVSAYVMQAQRALRGAPDSSRVLLDSARSMLALVAEAGGQHNVELSDLIFRTSVSNTTTAYRLAGRTAPAAPALGNKPHVGTCSFCHYSTTENWDFKAMPAGVHEKLVRRTE
ncbi:MAG TPA: cytochrome c3 family protein [Longimicrobiales bacterium]